MKTTLLRKTITAFFSVMLVVNVFLPSLIYLNFKVNQEFITSNLCVEREIEESSCNGNCQLKKSLAIVEVIKPQKENFQVTRLF
jgi:regulatory protein YycI of two-component signal transduction system YycFG